MEQKCQTSPELHSSRIVHRGNLTSIVVWNFGHTRYIYYELICFCLSLFGFLKQGNRNWVAKQQTFMSHSSGDWEVEGQGSGRFHVWWDPFFWFTDNCLITVSAHSGMGWGALWDLFCLRALIPFMGNFPLSSLLLHDLFTTHRPHIQIPSYRRLRFNTWTCEGRGLMIHSIEAS